MNMADGNVQETPGPSTNGNGHKMHFDILKEAKDQGIAKSYREIAKKLKVAPTTLSNIVHGRSDGSASTRRKVERLFGKPLEKLGDGTPPARQAIVKRGRRAKTVSAPEMQTEEPTLTMEGAYEIAAKLNPQIREAARAALQGALEKIDSES
jgi:transcriptional regulator with XRE-family HTH domain